MIVFHYTYWCLWLLALEQFLQHLGHSLRRTFWTYSTSTRPSKTIEKTTLEGQIFADSYLQLSKPLQAITGKADQNHLYNFEVDEATKFILNCYQHGKVYSVVCKKHSGIPEKTPPAGFEEKNLHSTDRILHSIWHL